MAPAVSPAPVYAQEKEEEARKTSSLKPQHYTGIGPVDESGIPIAIRTVSRQQYLNQAPYAVERLIQSCFKCFEKASLVRGCFCVEKCDVSVIPIAIEWQVTVVFIVL